VCPGFVLVRFRSPVFFFFLFLFCFFLSCEGVDGWSAVI